MGSQRRAARAAAAAQQEQARIQEQQRLDQAATARLQSDQMLASVYQYESIVAQELDEFDLMAGRSAGTSALALARSGNLTRAEAQGINVDPTLNGALQEINFVEENRNFVNSQIEAYNDTSLDAAQPDARRRNELRSEVSELEAEIQRIKSAPTEYDDDGNEITRSTKGVEKQLKKVSRDLKDQEQRVQDMVTTLQDGQARIEEFADNVNKLSDPNTIQDFVEDSALMFTRGSVFSMVEQGVSETIYNRNKYFQQGVSNSIGLINQAMAVRLGAEYNEREAASFNSLQGLIKNQAEAEERAQRMSNIFTVVGMVAGVALGGAGLLGLTVGSGLKAGATAGSFLGNIF